MSLINEIIELGTIKINLHAEASNEDIIQGNKNVEEDPMDNAIVETSKYTQNDILNDPKDYTEANDDQNNAIHVVLEDENVSTRMTVRPVSKIKRYRRPTFWVQFVQKKQDVMSDVLKKPEKVDKRLNPLSHGVRWLQQDGLDPIPPKPEFQYDRQTQNKFVTKVFTVLLIMLLLTLALEFVYLQVLYKEPYKRREKSRYPYDGPEKIPEKIYVENELFRQRLPISGLESIVLSMSALFILNYFWSFTSMTFDSHCVLYLTSILAVLAMSWLATAVTVVTDSYVSFFALFGTIIAVTICLILSVIPRFKIDFRSKMLYTWISVTICLLSVSVALTISRTKGVVIYTSVTDLIVFLVMNELRLILNHSILSVRIYDKEYFLVACFMFVSPFTVFLKLIWIFDCLDFN